LYKQQQQRRVKKVELQPKMLAPRKKLWSTPSEVLDKALELLEITSSDVVFDVGAGDGRFVIRCAESTSASRVVGVEIDEERGGAAQAAIASLEASISSRIEYIIGNALEQDYSSGSVFFLYLVPRGLRIMLPLLKAIPRKLRVVTYMSPFPDDVGASLVQVVKVPTAGHAEAEWPLYHYIINSHL